MDARLAHASVWVRRSQPDGLGRPTPLSEEQRLGALLHELGHALGFQGHARLGRGVMLPSPESVERVARRVLAGQPLRDPELSALYAIPSGLVVGRLRLEEDPSGRVEWMGRAAAREGLAGPFARVGDEAAMWLWRRAARSGEPTSTGAPAAAPGLVVRDWPRVLRDPTLFTLRPNKAAWQLVNRPRGPAASPGP